MPAPRRFVEFDEGTRVKAIRGALKTPRAALMAAGAVLVAQAQRAFRQQRKGRFSWPPRQVPNIAGILSDLNRGASVKARRFQPRPALVDTGALRSSITFRIVGGTAVEVGTAIPYASIHQEGGEVTIQITDRAKRGLSKLGRQKPQFVEGFEQLAEKDSVTISVRRRPFLLVTAEDLRELNEAMQAAVAAEVRR